MSHCEVSDQIHLNKIKQAKEQLREAVAAAEEAGLKVVWDFKPEKDEPGNTVTERRSFVFQITPPRMLDEVELSVVRTYK